MQPKVDTHNLTIVASYVYVQVKEIQKKQQQQQQTDFHHPLCFLFTAGPSVSALTRVFTLVRNTSVSWPASVPVVHHSAHEELKKLHLEAERRGLLECLLWLETLSL